MNQWPLVSKGWHVLTLQDFVLKLTKDWQEMTRAQEEAGSSCLDFKCFELLEKAFLRSCSLHIILFLEIKQVFLGFIKQP